MGTTNPGDSARQMAFSCRMARLANRLTRNYYTKRKVLGLVEGIDDKSVPELLRRAKRGEPVIAVLSGMVAKGGSRGADAAHMIGKLSEEGVECGETAGPLKGMLYSGTGMEKGVAAHALIRIRSKEALSALLEALESPDRKVRMAVDMMISTGRAALEDGEQNEGLEIRELSTKLLERYFWQREC